MNEEQKREFDRRDILKLGALAGLSTAFGGLSTIGSAFPGLRSIDTLSLQAP